jgi:hypothetical protein
MRFLRPTQLARKFGWSLDSSPPSPRLAGSKAWTGTKGQQVWCLAKGLTKTSYGPLAGQC